MKILKYNLGLALASIAIFSSCDKIDNPYPKAFSEGAVCSTQEFDIVTSAPARILIEDYTGHQCGNCPEAAVLASAIEHDYPENVITMAVHAGFFARTRPSGKFSTDFECETGFEWDESFGISAVGNPNGMINRISQNGSMVIGLGKWRSTVNSLLPKEATLEINLAGTIDDSDSTICGQIYIQPFSNLDKSINYSFNLVLLEDSIVDWQKDYSVPEGVDEDVEFYVHNHVLRKSFVGPSGVSFSLNEVTSNSYLTFGYKIAQDPEWRKDKLSLVGFVFNNETSEVLQVKKIKLKP